QDAPAYVDFGVEHHLTVMLPVDAFTRENGCLEMAREACARVFVPQNPDGTVRADAMARLTLEPLLAEPGDAIVFDAWVPHQSGPNRSADPRRSYYLTYNPASAGDRRGRRARPRRPLAPAAGAACLLSACRRKTRRTRAGRIAQRGGGGAVGAPMRRRARPPIEAPDSAAPNRSGDGAPASPHRRLGSHS